MSPADKGGIATCRKPGLGWLQGRYPRTSEGDNALLMTRSAKRPNSVSQTLRNLKPGRLYTMRMYTCDRKDASKRQEHAVSIKLDNATVIPDRSLSIAYQACHGKGWLGYHWRLFRAKGTTAKLTISDWPSDGEPGGPATAGQELMFNFIQVQPYFGETEPSEPVADWWRVQGKTCVAAYQAVGAEGFQASTVNLARPATHNLKLLGVAPAWSAEEGWMFDGSGDGYFGTGVLPRLGCSLVVHIANAAGGIPVGADAAANHDMFIEVTGGRIWWRYDGKTRSSPPGFMGGVLALAGPNAYRDGQIDIEGMGGEWPSAPGTATFFVGARNKVGTPMNFFRGDILAVAIYSDTLSAEEVATLTRRMRAMAAAPVRERK